MRAFAQKLRSLFSELGMSSRRYAENIAHVDVSALSRCFSGQRAPTWEHVDTLIREVTPLAVNDVGDVSFVLADRQ